MLRRPTATPIPAPKLAAHLLGLLVLASSGVGAQAQLSPATLQRLNNNLANDAVSAVEVFSAADVIATGSFAYDNPGPQDVKFNTYKLPYAHEFGSATNTLRYFAEGYLGYFDLSQDVTSFGPPPGEIQIRSLTATVGGGMAWAATDWLTLSPRLLFAYSHAWHHFDRLAPPGDPFANALPDWEVDALTLLPSFTLKVAQTYGRWDLALNSSYTYLRVLGLHDNSTLIQLDSKSQVWRNEITASYRAPWTIYDLALRPFGTFARHDLAGQIRRSDFIEFFYEARLGLGLTTPPWLKPVSEVSVSFAYYFEGPFTGYSFGVDLAF